MSKVPVSVCIIAKNEEKHIGECLKRLRPYGFEIVVTDTGSTDRTKEIAQMYADKVLDFEWCNDFSAARNFCVSHASNNWIMSLDCDEYVNSIDVGTLRILMQKFPKDTGVIRLKNLLYKDNHVEYGSDDVTRFYNRNYYTFIQPIHEQISYKDASRREEVMKTFLIPMEVIHHGYALSPEEMQEKQRRNLELLYASLDNAEDDPYLHFQIAQSEFVLGDIEKAAAEYEKALAMEDNTQYEYIQIAIMSLARTYVQLGKMQEAVSLIEKYAPSVHTAKYTFTHAGVMLDSGNIVKALMLYVKTTTMPDVDRLGENLLHCYEHIIEIQTGLGNLEMAELFREKYEACIAEKERVLNS